LNPDLGISELLDRDEVSVKDTPDLFTLLEVCALKRDRSTVIRDTGRLRDKESDRIMSTASMLESLGGRMEAFDDHVVVHGCEGSLHGGIVRSFGDHRIVMAAAVASLMCSSPVIIRGADAVKKSAPQFFEDFRSLGGCVYEYDRQRS
jgi:3-phosphoshikimate 1-carboxyvinyltransferase